MPEILKNILNSMTDKNEKGDIHFKFICKDISRYKLKYDIGYMKDSI
jgi:hypothetical protein